MSLLQSVEQAYIKARTNQTTQDWKKKMNRFFEQTKTNLVDRYVQWRDFRKAVNELNMLSDATLNDIGIHRSQIKSFIAASMQDNDIQIKDDQSAA